MALFAASDKTAVRKLKEEGCVVTLQVEIPAARVREAVQTVLVQFQSQARVSGFRAGKAPLEIVQKHYAPQIREKAVDRLLREGLGEALRELDLRPVCVPAVEEVRMDDGRPLSFQLRLERTPKFQPKGYKGLQVARKNRPVTEEEISRRMEELREGNARLERAPEETVGREHYVLMDYAGYRDGSPLKDAKGSDRLLDLSSPGSLEGLAEGLAGAKRGETRRIPVTLEGKAAEFEVTVKEIKRKLLPAADDEFAKDLGAGSIAELRGNLRAVLEEEGRRKSEREVASQLEEGLLKANRFPVPPSLVEHALARMLERLRREVLGPRRDWPESERAKLLEQLRPRAEDETRMYYLLRAVAQAEKIEVAPQDLEAERAAALRESRSPEDRAKLEKFLEESKEQLSDALLERKVMKFLRDSAVVAEA